MIEEEIRADERKRIARHLTVVATNMIIAPESDGIDGYTAAVILSLAETIEESQ